LQVTGSQLRLLVASSKDGMTVFLLIETNKNKQTTKLRLIEFVTQNKLFEILSLTTT